MESSPAFTKRQRQQAYAQALERQIAQRNDSKLPQLVPTKTLPRSHQGSSPGPPKEEPDQHSLLRRVEKLEQERAKFQTMIPTEGSSNQRMDHFHYEISQLRQKVDETKAGLKLGMTALDERFNNFDAKLHARDLHLSSLTEQEHQDASSIVQNRSEALGKIDFLTSQVIRLEKQMNQTNVTNTKVANQMMSFNEEFDSKMVGIEQLIVSKCREQLKFQQDHWKQQHAKDEMYNQLARTRADHDKSLHDARIEALEKAVHEERTSRLNLEKYFELKMETKEQTLDNFHQSITNTSKAQMKELLESLTQQYHQLEEQVQYQLNEVQQQVRSQVSSSSCRSSSTPPLGRQNEDFQQQLETLEEVVRVEITQRIQAIEAQTIHLNELQQQVTQVETFPQQITTEITNIQARNETFQEQLHQRQQAYETQLRHQIEALTSTIVEKAAQEDDLIWMISSRVDQQRNRLEYDHNQLHEQLESCLEKVEELRQIYHQHQQETQLQFHQLSTTLDTKATATSLPSVPAPAPEQTPTTHEFQQHLNQALDEHFESKWLQQIEKEDQAKETQEKFHQTQTQFQEEIDKLKHQHITTLNQLGKIIKDTQMIQQQTQEHKKQSQLQQQLLQQLEEEFPTSLQSVNTKYQHLYDHIQQDLTKSKEHFAQEIQHLTKRNHQYQLTTTSDIHKLESQLHLELERTQQQLTQLLQQESTTRSSEISAVDKTIPTQITAAQSLLKQWLVHELQALKTLQKANVQAEASARMYALNQTTASLHERLNQQEQMLIQTIASTKDEAIETIENAILHEQTARITNTRKFRREYEWREKEKAQMNVIRLTMDQLVDLVVEENEHEHVMQLTEEFTSLLQTQHKQHTRALTQLAFEKDQQLEHMAIEQQVTQVLDSICHQIHEQQLEQQFQATTTHVAHDIHVLEKTVGTKRRRDSLLWAEQHTSLRDELVVANSHTSSSFEKLNQRVTKHWESHLRLQDITNQNCITLAMNVVNEQAVQYCLENVIDQVVEEHQQTHLHAKVQALTEQATNQSARTTKKMHEEVDRIAITMKKEQEFTQKLHQQVENHGAHLAKAQVQADEHAEKLDKGIQLVKEDIGQLKDRQAQAGKTIDTIEAKLIECSTEIGKIEEQTSEMNQQTTSTKEVVNELKKEMETLAKEQKEMVQKQENVESMSKPNEPEPGNVKKDEPKEKTKDPEPTDAKKEDIEKEETKPNESKENEKSNDIQPEPTASTPPK